MKAIKDRLYKDVEFLTTISPPRNWENLASLNKVAEYIFNEFSELGFDVSYQTYKAEGNEYKNVIASFNQQKGERIIVGAHYDVFGDFSGADDNASAVAGLLETARLLQQEQPSLDYQIDFVAYSLEEPPFFATEKMGSAIHAKYLADNNIKVKLMICYEMIGYFSDEPNSQEFPVPLLQKLYPDTGNFIVVVGKPSQIGVVNKFHSLMKKHTQIDVRKFALPFAEELASLSDHRNYWNQGMKAVMINNTSFLRNPNYHTEYDTIDTLNFEKMAQVVDGVYGAIINY